MLKSYGISGRECEAGLELLSSNADVGKIAWFYGEENPDDFRVVYENRTSILVHSSGKKIIGAEHLSAAALAFPGYQFKLSAPQGELPLLDGSAKLWKMELKSIVGADPRTCPLLFYNFPETETKFQTDTRFIKFQKKQNNCLQIKYTINRFGQQFSANVKLSSTKDLEKILLARSYIFAEELPKAGLSENLRGCGIVLGEGESLLFENEPAFHKILDFLGDITLYSGILPSGYFEIFNGGHELHHKVLDRFFLKLL
ncbi:MAG: UDP-3-O-acyl-N-acetylglucosamine deacetylase [Fibromonadaceae bacterium]|jgi:UDP-3-O-acyl-N-acetylglucosamine deacetylase|nr:UDP-3-O-acyl-N-acetylglucosamine deacetylase [Fibromonadaceae bacterium]